MLINGAGLTNENFSKERKSSMCTEDKVGTYIADKKYYFLFLHFFGTKLVKLPLFDDHFK